MPKTIYSKEHKKITEKLKKARREAGLTQLEVGKKFGLDQTFVSKVESGQYRLDAIQLRQFAEIYKKNIKYFLS
jgi:transcriptional regulator with XRE-family HTH domain